MLHGVLIIKNNEIKNTDKSCPVGFCQTECKSSYFIFLKPNVNNKIFVAVPKLLILTKNWFITFLVFRLVIILFYMYALLFKII